MAAEAHMYEKESTGIEIYPPSETNGNFSDYTLKDENQHEVFKKEEGKVDFRTTGWLRASSIMIKGKSPGFCRIRLISPRCLVQFALGVLNIPSNLYVLGALPGSLVIVGYAFLNTYNGVLFGDFKLRHPGIYDVKDVAYVVGGPVLREIMSALYMIGCAFCVASSCVGLSVAFNSLSHHAACSVWWSFMSMMVIAVGASFRKFHTIGWLTWAGFLSMYVSVFIVV
jgi:hypothetical protein